MPLPASIVLDSDDPRAAESDQQRVEPIVAGSIETGVIQAQPIGTSSIQAPSTQAPSISSQPIQTPAIEVPAMSAPVAEVDAIEVAECVVEPVRSTEIQAAHRPEISRWRRPLRKNERTSNVFSLPILLGKLRSLWWWWAVILVVAASDGRREPRQTPHLVSQLTLYEHVGV